MLNCLPSRYRFLDLIIALGGTLTFLVDLGLDVWAAVQYYRAGDLAWAALQLSFYGLSSVALQFLSWGWLWVDRQDRLKCRQGGQEDRGEHGENGTPHGKCCLELQPYNSPPGQGTEGGASNKTGDSRVINGLNGFQAPALVDSAAAGGDMGDHTPDTVPTPGRGDGGMLDIPDSECPDRGDGSILDIPDSECPDRGDGSILDIPDSECPDRGDGSILDIPDSECPDRENFAMLHTPQSASPDSRNGAMLPTPDCPDAQPWLPAEAYKVEWPGQQAVPQCPEDQSAWRDIYRNEISQGNSEIQNSLLTSRLDNFYTSRPLYCHSLATILHILQLGYPLRCIHSLEVGVAAYRSKVGSTLSKQYQEDAYLVTHDISMMRLIETFLENTPQLILLLYIMLQRGIIQTFQYLGISVSFISISWAILDYHQSLRFFLKDKQKLDFLSSLVYFLWNILLIFSRIICITLFTSVFHLWITLHYFLLWAVFFLWAGLQKTDFMKHTLFEYFYRAIVAGVLYFSWFNISEGKTIYRCIFYYVFIMSDNTILLLSWKYLGYSTVLDAYELTIFLVVGLALFIGLAVRVLYYVYLHPNVSTDTKECYDEPDGSRNGEISNKSLLVYKVPAAPKHPRMLQTWKQMFLEMELTRGATLCQGGHTW
ncbi:XK-related protein 8 [Pelobates fuscus]|uniref:XK-related protein 8 n=1 Tax=Pelobates fuscus TaxID=191477 RepID=UPI002FE4AE71